jgi:hypothetical protein
VADRRVALSSYGEHIGWHIDGVVGAIRPLFLLG